MGISTDWILGFDQKFSERDKQLIKEALQYFYLPTYLEDYYTGVLSDNSPEKYGPEFMWMVGVVDNTVIFIPSILEDENFLHFQKWGEKQGRAAGRSALKIIREEGLIVKVPVD